MTTYGDPRDLPPGNLRRLHRRQMKARQAEREALDDTPEGEDRRWGPKRIKQIIQRDGRQDDD
jgi:hypothetical protein